MEVGTFPTSVIGTNGKVLPMVQFETQITWIKEEVSPEKDRFTLELKSRPTHEQFQS